jgi:peptidoglycan-N-acetylglucosamine deacetylase
MTPVETSLRGLVVPDAGAVAGNGAGARSRYACIALDYEDIKHLYRTLNLGAQGGEGVAYGVIADRFLEILDRHGVKATLFVVGEDFLDANNRRGLRRFVAAGHEVANHTMTHPFGMRRMSHVDKVREITQAQKILEDITGRPVVGYKAPAHDIDAEVIDILEQQGFLYDASVYPSVFNPLLNVCYRIFGGGRPLGLGVWQCSFAPNRPYRVGYPFWRSGTRRLVEFPISQLPGVRFPFYATPMFVTGVGIFRLTFEWVRHMRFVTFVFHSFDLFGEDDGGFVPALRSYPALRRPIAERLEMVDLAIGALARHFRTVTYSEVVTDPAICDAIL